MSILTFYLIGVVSAAVLNIIYIICRLFKDEITPHRYAWIYLIAAAVVSTITLGVLSYIGVGLAIYELIRLPKEPKEYVP